MRGTFVICWSFVNFNHFLLLAPFRNKTVSQLCTILALTSYLKCVDVCRYFVDDCAEADRQRDCFAACGSTASPSTTALLPSICPLWHCAFSLLPVSIWALHPADTHWKSLTLFTASALWNVYPFVQPWLSIGEKNKTETKAHSVRCETRLTGQMPMIQISSFVGVCVCWWCSSLSSASP